MRVGSALEVRCRLRPAEAGYRFVASVRSRTRVSSIVQKGIAAILGSGGKSGHGFAGAARSRTVILSPASSVINVKGVSGLLPPIWPC